jgi:hypothetical protein
MRQLQNQYRIDVTLFFCDFSIRELFLLFDIGVAQISEDSYRVLSSVLLRRIHWQDQYLSLVPFLLFLRHFYCNRVIAESQ